MTTEISQDVVAFLSSASDLYGKYKAEEYSQYLWMEFGQISSPIEQLFLVALGVVAEINCIDFNMAKVLPRHEDQFIVQGQFPVSNYKVDFALAYHVYPIVCVELDGHDFHDRDERQRRYEKQRDRYLVTNGFTVMHFTGAEVVKDPYAVALEAFNAATKLAEVSVHPKEYFGE